MRKLIYTFGMIAAMAMTACSNPREAVIDGEMTAEGWNGKNIELINSGRNDCRRMERKKHRADKQRDK